MHTKHLFTFIKHNETIRIGKLINTEDTYLNIRLSGELLADRLPDVVGDLVQIYRPSLLHVGFPLYSPLSRVIQPMSRYLPRRCILQETNLTGKLDLALFY